MRDLGGDDRMTDAALLQCSLSDWRGDPQRCRWCDFLLHGRQRRWCSAECRDRMVTNHYWSFARASALKRDAYRCVRCGARKLARIKGRIIRRRLDVHHMTPVRGKRAECGCHHHLDGLETLCGGKRDTCHGAEHWGGLLEVAA